jgi:hypothetical protein
VAANKIAGHTLWHRAKRVLGSSEESRGGRRFNYLAAVVVAAAAAAERCYKDASEIIFYMEKSGAINLICQAENTVHISCEIQAAANMESLTIRGCCFCGGKDELWGC